MPSYKVTANSSTATPISSGSTAEDGIITIANDDQSVDAWLLHMPQNGPPTAADVVAYGIQIGSRSNPSRDQIQIGSPGPRDLSGYYVATQSGTAGICVIS